MKTLSSLFLLCAAALVGAERDDMHQERNMPQSCTPKKCERYNSMCPAPEVGAYNAPVLLGLENAWDIAVNGSFVYLQAREDNLNFINSAASITNGLGSGETHTHKFGKVDFNYKPAFKVGLDADFGCDQWNVAVDYFRYHATPGSGRFSETRLPDPASDYQANLYWAATGDGYDADEFDTSANEGIIVSASSKWKLEMDLLDLGLGRNYYVGQMLTFKPHMGLRGGWIDQSYNVNYVGDFTTTNLQTTTTSNNTTNSWAVGFRAGLDAQWDYMWGAFLFGKANGSILYTRYTKIKSAQTSTQVNSTTGALQFTNIYSMPSRGVGALRPQADLSMGLGWADTLYGKVYLDLRVSYDMQVFWNQNMFQNFYDNSQDPTAISGNLYLQGLVVSAALSF